MDGFFAIYGYEVVDELMAVDEDGTHTRFAAVLADLTAPTVGLTVFRGTKYKREWESDAEAWLVNNPWGPGKIHNGFERIGLTIYLKSGRSLTWLRSAFTTMRVMGHSLGGPEATMLAARICADELICYASPKAGDLAFARWVQGRVRTITLYQNAGDLVPRLPFTIEDPLDEFDFQPVIETVMMDARKYLPPVLLSVTMPSTLEQRLEDAHSTITSYKPLIAALP